MCLYSILGIPTISQFKQKTHLFGNTKITVHLKLRGYRGSDDWLLVDKTDDTGDDEGPIRCYVHKQLRRPL